MQIVLTLWSCAGSLIALALAPLLLAAGAAGAAGIADVVRVGSVVAVVVPVGVAGVAGVMLLSAAVVRSRDVAVSEASDVFSLAGIGGTSFGRLVLALVT